MTEQAPVREWFEDAERQAYAASVGMWLFLGSELLLFAGLFALYWAYRVVYPVEFAAAAHHNEVVIGTVPMSSSPPASPSPGPSTRCAPGDAEWRCSRSRRPSCSRRCSSC